MFPFDLVQIWNFDRINRIKRLLFIDLLLACMLFHKCTAPVVEPE